MWGLTWTEVGALAFVAVGTAATLLQYHLWRYPYDEERHVSAAPRRWIRVHRWLGVVYVGLYVAMLFHMVPRAWTYQVELPARSVMHLTLAVMIGAILIVKLFIVRFQRHLEKTLVPQLGTALFVCTFTLVALVVPFANQERALARTGLAGDAFGADGLERVRRLLPLAGLGDADSILRLASPERLVRGREVLRARCTQCHDLRTVLARPRTPDAWRRTVERMAARSSILSPIDDEDGWSVTAYLIAITPTLQETVERLRAVERASSDDSVRVEGLLQAALASDYDRAAGERLWRARCSLCHDPDRLRQRPPSSPEEAEQLIRRMVSNGLSAPRDELAMVLRYIVEDVVRPAR